MKRILKDTQLKKSELIIILILIVIVTTFNVHSLLQTNLVEKNFIKDFKKQAIEIKDIISKDKVTETEVYYYIEDKMLLKIENKEKKEIKKIGEFNGDGTILVKDNKIEDFQLQNKEYCATIKNDKILIEKKTCTIVGEKENITDKINKTSLKTELIDDTEETGLDTTLPFSSKKYYIGENPNNYLVFENSCYRIMNVAQNDTVKIIYEAPVDQYGTCREVAKDNSGYVALLAWNNEKKTKITWEDSYLNYSMQRWVEYEEIEMVDLKVELDNTKIADAEWYTGQVQRSNNLLIEDIKNERSIIANKENNTDRKIKMGLINVSDYLKIDCKKSINKHDDSCKNNNYLYKIGYDYWTVNSINDVDNEVWQVTLSGDIESLTIPYSREYSYSGIRPVMYLNANNVVKGTGVSENPYVVY